MNLVWKLLRQHISIPQFAGFAFANLFGMLIVLLGYQFYKDVSPVFTGDDSFMKSNYIIAEKKIGTGSTLSGRSNAFTKQDIDDIHAAHFATRIGAFTATQNSFLKAFPMILSTRLRVPGIISPATMWCQSFFPVVILRCITLALRKVVHFQRLAMGLWA